jgi:hypothetical protein
MRIIDGNNLLHRVAEKPSYGGIHPVREVFTRFYSPPETTIIVWDGPYANKRRQEIFPEYKMNRRDREESKFKFFEIAKGVLRFTPVIQVEIPGWEADDIIGTMVDRWHTERRIIVETNDGDYWQHSDKCLLPLVSKKWHKFTPEDCILYKALVGEAKDNVKGVKGFGPKSWDYFDKDTRDRLRLAIKTEDYSLFLTCDNWPPKIKRTEQLFKDVCLYWKLNQCWTVPEEEIDDALFVGRPNLQAAEIFMENYLI